MATTLTDSRQNSAQAALAIARRALPGALTSGSRMRHRLRETLHSSWLTPIAVSLTTLLCVGTWPDSTRQVAYGVLLSLVVAVSLAGLLVHISQSSMQRDTIRLRAVEHYQRVALLLSSRALICTDLQSFLNEATALLARNLGVEYCAVLELVTKDCILVLRAASGWPDSCLGRPVLGPEGKSSSGDAAGAWQRAAGARSGVSVSIRSGSRTYGLLDMYTSRPRVFSSEETHFIEIIAQIVGAAIERDQDERAQRTANVALAFRAFHDPLTGLPNRALLEDRLRHAMARIRRDPRPMAVLFVDLDDFKGVNDSLGHTAGDQVLVEVAQRLKACLREGDTAARLGGDEFVVLLELASEREAAHIEARIRQALNAPILVHDQLLYVGASIGRAVSSVCPIDAEALLREADLAMYRAKRAGARQTHQSHRDPLQLEPNGPRVASSAYVAATST